MSAPDDAPRSAPKIPLAQGAVTHVAQIGCQPAFPFPKAYLCRDLCDGDAERGKAVEYGDPDLELCDLTV